MANNTRQIEYCCSICGTPLTEENSRENAYTCLECESKRFKQLEEKNGTHIALFLMCGMVNLPLEPMIIPADFADFEGNKWQEYCNLLKDNNKLEKNGKIRGFLDGKSDIRQIFGREMNYTDFSGYVAHEQEKIDELEGTEEQREKWGTGKLWSKTEMTSHIYDELDRQYENRAASYKGQTITPQMEDTLIKVAKFNTVIDILMEEGDSKTILDIQKTVDNLLASEQMRKKDEKPIETFALDAWIVALEKSGLMKDGDFLTFEETENALIKILKGKGYEQTLDAIYQLEMNILNNARRNEDLPLLYELPENMQVKDHLGEFATKEGQEEKDAKAYAKLAKVRVEKKEKASKGAKE